MADQDTFELDLDLGDDPNINNRANERIRDLSSKVKEKAQETESERKLREEAESRATQAEKRAEFLEAFSTQTAKYPDAAEFRDAIQEKVMAGYSVDDATVAVLAANNKFNPPAPEMQPEGTIAAGGSAATELPQYADKQLNEMSREEKRQALIDADQSGELRKVLKY